MIIVTKFLPYLLRLSHSARKFIEGRWPFMFQYGATADELIG
jgi:hypothetical protein